jgi:hypothetical protein
MGWIVTGNSQILAVHAALLRSCVNVGQILYFSGDEHDRGHHNNNHIDHTRLYECATGAITNPHSPTTDLFCCGQALMADGRLLVAGGTHDFNVDPDPHGDPHEHARLEHFRGVRDAWIFDTFFATWTAAAAMNFEPGRGEGGGRWYPTLLTLPSGDVLAMSGHPMPEDTRHNNTSPERYQPAANAWELMRDDREREIIYYPRLHVLPDGAVFCSNWVSPTRRTQKLDAYADTWSDICPGPTDPLYNDIPTTSVLLPLRPDNYAARVLICGANRPQRIDLSVAVPGWTDTAPRALAGSPRRRHCCAVLLPTGEVFVCGGVSDDNNSDTSAVLEAELYNPETDAWNVLERATVPRNYHSVALLMPDGRVWTAGGNSNAQQSFPAPGVDNRELRIELYEPSYYGRPDRPQISNAPAQINCGQTFTVESPHADEIDRVMLLRTGSVTHAFNSDQRAIELKHHRGRGNLQIEAPPNTNIAPPGDYLLFLLNRENIPSVGRFVRVRAVTHTFVVLHLDNPAGENRGHFRVGRGVNPAGQVAGGWSNPAAIPGWFGHENQGGDVAAADLTGNGRPDLFVLHLDNPSGDNRGYYRVGKDMDAVGNITGGWSAPIAIPDWFGHENQGGGIAVGDISGNGRPDLVVFHIDNPGGDNHGYYRIGWNLDANGNVTGGWTQPILVPGWFGHENQGGGIALADINGSGRPDLVVFHVDNPGGDNHGYYRIGWNLDTSGNVTSGWTAPKPVPDWFGHESQGAGIAVADLNGNGRPDLVVFHIDNPGGDNHGYYRIGWNLDANGDVTGGWTQPILVPGWFGHENQGGGIACIRA